MINEPMKTPSTEDGGQPHDAVFQAEEPPHRELHRNRLRVFNAAKFLDSSISRLKALPKMKPRKGADKRSVRFFSELQPNETAGRRSTSICEESVWHSRQMQSSERRRSPQSTQEKGHGLILENLQGAWQALCRLFNSAIT
jgi:hypothetical protein